MKKLTFEELFDKLENDCNNRFVIPAKICSISMNGKEKLKEIKKEVKNVWQK